MLNGPELSRRRGAAGTWAGTLSLTRDIGTGSGLGLSAGRPGRDWGLSPWLETWTGLGLGLESPMASLDLDCSHLSVCRTPVSSPALCVAWAAIWYREHMESVWGPFARCENTSTDVQIDILL